MAGSDFTLYGTRIANASRSWQADQDVDVADWVKASDFIVAAAVGMGAHSSGTENVQLRWRDTDGGSFAALAATGELNWTGITDLANGTAVATGEKGATNITGDPLTTYIDGIEREGANDCNTTVGNNEWTEHHWAVDGSGADDGHKYEFEIYSTTEGAQVGLCLADITIATPADLEVIAFDLPTIEENLAPKENLGPISQFDKITLIEFLELLKDILPSVFDNLTIIENINARLSDLPIDVFDLPTIIEDITLSLGVSPVEINVNDQLTITEFKAGLIAAYITISEWVQVQTGIEDISVSVSDLLTVIENIQVEKDSDISVSVSDFLTIIEGTYGVSDIGLDVTVAEFVQLGIGAESLGINVYDSPTVEENLTPLENLGPISKEEQLRIAEYLSLLKDILPDKYELLTIQEIINMAIEGAAPQVDAYELATIAEYIAMSMPIKMSVYESITLQEVVSHLLDIIPSVYESLTVGEYVAMLQEILVGAVDSINVSEYVNVAMVLATGLMSVTFTARKPDIEFAGRKPGIEFTGRKPDIIFTGSGG